MCRILFCLPSDSCIYIYTAVHPLPPLSTSYLTVMETQGFFCVQIPKHTHFFSLQQHKKEVLRAALNPFGGRSQKVKPNTNVCVSESVDIIIVWKCCFLITSELRFPTGEKQDTVRGIKTLLDSLRATSISEHKLYR